MDPIRVLIADDHKMFREALRIRLEAEADIAVVGEAADAIEVLQLVSTVPADVLLLDLAMPGGGGFDALTRLTEQGTEVRTIVVTGSGESRDVVEAVRLGARGVVIKDEPLELLVKSIKRVAAGDFWIAHDRMAALLRQLHSSPAPAQAPAPRRPADTLTPRERDVIAGIAVGESNKDLGARLGVSEHTIKNHLSSVFDKLGVANRLELALYAVHHHLIQ